MHQLAIAMKNKGYGVTGSDDEITEPSRSALDRAGILPREMGWHEKSVSKDLDAVILGMHAREDNPELIKARQLEIPIYSFPEYIYQVSRDKTRVVIGGSHGKTTITSMIMHVLQHAGRDFDYLVGARLDGFPYAVKITDAPLLICEGDEYPASTLERKPKFHFLAPKIAVISGIAWDHINVFPSLEDYLSQFAIFIRQIPKDGSLIYNMTDAKVEKLVAGHAGEIRLLPYGLPDYRIENHRTMVFFEGHHSELEIFGEHNLLNVQAARLVCQELGIGPREFLEAIHSFRGASRRLELVAANTHSFIYRDFAHAPSKVNATILAVKKQFPDKKLIAVFELHTYSSLSKTFLSQYAGAMDLADLAVVFYSPHALQLKKLPELSRLDIHDGFRREDLHIFNTLPDLSQFLDRQQYADTVLLLMSSGNFEGLNMENLKKYL